MYDLKFLIYFRTDIQDFHCSFVNRHKFGSRCFYKARENLAFGLIKNAFLVGNSDKHHLPNMPERVGNSVELCALVDTWQIHEILQIEILSYFWIPLLIL